MDPSYVHTTPPGVPVTAPYSQEESTWFQDDGMWLISCSFSIWTMVSGFGLLESGRVSSKDEVNIMVKNIVDVVFGGLSYWMFGFGFTFGKEQSNQYIGIGYFFYNPESDGQPEDQAWHYSRFFFQMSFATTTSTIVSAAMAERIRLKPYIVITFLMTLVHSIAAHWVWSEDGFLFKLGCVDAAGCSVVHLIGGVAGLASTLYLKPRQARFGERGTAHMSNPTNALLGTFMLWWGWLAFNTGTTMGVSNGRSRLAARSAMVTLLSSIGGGCTSIIISLISTRKCQIDLLIDGLLASLVATTAGCHSLRPVESIAVGAIGSALALSIYPLVERLEIDDPVGVIPVHVVGATWGMLCVGIFSREDDVIFSRDNKGVTRGKNGLLHGGGFELLFVQLLCVICIFVFSLVVTFLSLMIMNQFPWGLRMTKYEEQLGADLIEHGLAGHNIAKYSIEKKLNVKNAYSVVKFVAKWKRVARKARERRAAEAAAAGIGPEASSGRAMTTAGEGRQSPIRLGPLKLIGGLRRNSNMLGPESNSVGPSGTLSARPKSGNKRLMIEKDKNSLPPMHSARIHPMRAGIKTSLDSSREIPNGVPGLGNGVVPLGRPIVVTRPPSSPTIERIPNLPIGQQQQEEEAENPQSNLYHRENNRQQRRGGGSIIGRLRRGSRVSPRRNEIQLQEQPARRPVEEPQAPFSARSMVSIRQRAHAEVVQTQVKGSDSEEQGSQTSSAGKKHANDSIV